VSILRFGAFELDRKTGELRRAGELLSLPPQPLKILILLATHSGQLVTRENIQQQVWGTDTFVDFEQGLNFAINKIRAALGDDADSPRYIETLPRRGYRFIASVEVGVPPDLQRQQDAPTSVPLVSAQPLLREVAFTTTAGRVQSVNPRLSKWWMRRLTGMSLTLVVCVAVGWFVWRRDFLGTGHTASGRVQSLAVLPLENLTGDSAQEYFSDGMTDALITNLAQISALRVISRTSTMRYKKSAQSLPAIARELNVDAVVEGTVVRSGDKVKIDVRIIQVANDRPLWGKSYERDFHDIIGLQSEMAQAIGGAIRVQLTALEQARLNNTHPINSEAYDTYLKGHFHTVRENKDDNDQAIELLQRSLALDPNFARAYAELARAYTVRFSFFAPQDKQWEEKASVAVAKAVTLEPELAEAHLARGLLLWTPSNHFPHEEAAEEFHRALAGNPNLDDAHHYLAVIYLHTGLFDKAMKEAQDAVAINPSNTLARFRIGVILHHEGKYEEALAVLKTIPKEFQAAVVARQVAWTLFSMGRKDEAVAMISEALKSNPKDEGGQFSSMQAVFYAAGGDRRRAEEKIQLAAEQRKGFGHFHHTEYNIAAAYALLDESEKALVWLESAAVDGYPCYPLFATDSNLDNLRSDPQFRRFLADLEKQWEYYRKTL
jgi:TolB-like protein/DNA-binding winged helix-turn-helix (wHTH) protein/Tfp pilus assembly protein PilF